MTEPGSAVCNLVCNFSLAVRFAELAEGLKMIVLRVLRDISRIRKMAVASGTLVTLAP